jgi:hypothetical protein
MFLFRTPINFFLRSDGISDIIAIAFLPPNKLLSAANKTTTGKAYVSMRNLKDKNH